MKLKASFRINDVICDARERLRGAVEQEAEVERQNDDLANYVKLEASFPSHVETFQLNIFQNHLNYILKDLY